MRRWAKGVLEWMGRKGKRIGNGNGNGNFKPRISRMTQIKGGEIFFHP